MTDMKGKTVLITGANQGIGKATATALGRMGAGLVLVCRNADKARAAIAEIQRAGGGRVELLVGDLGSQASVRRVADEFRATHSRLDVLVNNAGVLVPSRRTTVDGIEETFATNHLAYFLLTNLLLGVLESSAPARIVNVSSEAHRHAQMRWGDLQWKEARYSALGAYGQSKLANVLFTLELARRLEGTGVTANCLHPGVVASGFGRTYGGVASLLVSIARPFMISPEQGARTSVYLASSPEVEGVTGKYFDKCRPREPSRAALEPGAGARLWAVSEEMTGLRGKSGAAA